MLSKILSAALLTAALAQGCGNSTDLATSNYKTEIGRRPEFFSTSYLFRAGDANSLTFVDRKGKTVQRFQLEPFQHQLTLPLPFNYDKQGVLASGNGEYFVAIGEDEYAIMKQDGTTELNPVGLAGRIESAAFDPVHHYLLVADEFKSMALMVLTPSGDIAGSWTAGNIFPGDKTVLAGTMLDDGRLDLASFRSLIDFHVNEGTDAIVVVGTTGESPTVTLAEASELVRRALRPPEAPRYGSEFPVFEVREGAAPITPEMVKADLELFRKDKYLREGGHQVFNYNE